MKCSYSIEKGKKSQRDPLAPARAAAWVFLKNSTAGGDMAGGLFLFFLIKYKKTIDK